MCRYCKQGTLKDHLFDARIEIDFARKLELALDTARGMAYLHKFRPAILHRDLKPENLLLGGDGRIKVADFGVTKTVGSRMQHGVGTPTWMAPEAILGQDYTLKADVYSFGIVLYEILVRQSAGEGMDPMHIVFEVVNNAHRPTIPSTCLNSPLVPLMQACWDTVPNNRPDFEDILDKLLAIQQTHKERLAHVPITVDVEFGNPG